jgi:ATP-dependent protease HslVU (ClpYQ) peptidase subunit
MASYTKTARSSQRANMLIGYTSSYRMGQLLEHSLIIPERETNQSIENYMYVDFINAVRELLKNNGQMQVDRNVQTIGFFLIVTEGLIFQMQDDLSLLEAADGFDACGSGESYARAALHLLKNQGKLSPKEMLTEAIDIAAQYVSSVGGEVKYLSDGPSN